MNMLIRLFILNSLMKRQHNKNSNSADFSSVNKIAQTHDIVLTPFQRSYRILPHDLGFRDHVPNYRFLSFIELNITGWLARSINALPALEKTKKDIKWIISMQEMVYLQQVKLFEKILLISQIESWDEKYIYFKHEFFTKNNLKAIGYTKFVLVDNKGKLSPSIFTLEGEKITNTIKTWNANQRAIKQQA